MPRTPERPRERAREQRGPQEPPQIELFPLQVTVTRLEPRMLLGTRTRVLGVFRVTYPGEARPHQVYHDRHGWYCEEHGAGCKAVRAARETGG